MLSRRLIVMLVLVFVGLGALFVTHSWRMQRKTANAPQVSQPTVPPPTPAPAPGFSEVKVAAKALVALGIELYDGQPAIDPELVADEAEVRIRRVVFTSSSQVTEGCIELLKGLPDLKGVSCYDTDVQDENLALLGKLSQIEAVNLNYTRVSDEGLRHLSGLAHVSDLGLNGTAVTNVGLAYVAGTGRKLIRLTLYDTTVSDEGLRHLEQCPMLAVLDVQKTQVTQSGIAALRDKLPTCRVFADPY